MRHHLLLTAPLLALGVACTEPCSAPTLTVAWQFALADGTPGASCQEAGVSKVSLWLDGQPAGIGMACAQGSATFTGISAGDHTYTIQGLAADGTPIYQTWDSVKGVTVDSCGETRVVLQPGAGVLRLNYSTSTGNCYGVGRPPEELGYVWFQLVDRSTNLPVSTVDGVHSPALLPCRTGTQGQVNIQLPWGLYQLYWMEVVTFPLSSSWTPIYQTCPLLTPAGATVKDVNLLHTGVTELGVPLVPPSACP